MSQSRLPLASTVVLTCVLCGCGDAAGGNLHAGGDAGTRTDRGSRQDGGRTDAGSTGTDAGRDATGLAGPRQNGVDAGSTGTDAGRAAGTQDGAAAADADAAGDAAATGDAGVIALAKPPPPAGGSTTGTERHTFALDRIEFGEAPRTSDTPSPDAWKEYGYDLDGIDSATGADDVCTPQAGGTSVADGPMGIDNSFGANILPFLQVYTTDPTKRTSASIANGDFTIQLQIEGLTPEASTQTNRDLTSQLFPAGRFDEAGALMPTFTPADDWPVRPDGLANPSDIGAGATVSFPSSYIADGTFVAGSPGTVTVRMVLQGGMLDLEIHEAVITMKLLSGDAAVEGTIAGIIETESLVDGMRRLAGQSSPSLCTGSAFESIAAQVRQASDILTDGTNRAGVPCSAISVGLGFTAKHIANPSKIGTQPGPDPDPCSP